MRRGDAEPKKVERPPADRNDSKASWISGYTYIVVQDFKADALADAKAAGRYLLDHGIETAIVQRGNEYISLVTLQGFNRDDPVQDKLAKDLLGRIRAAGRTYFEAGGRVRLEGYLKKLTKPSW